MPIKKKKISNTNLIRIGKFAVKIASDHSEYAADMGLILIQRYIRKVTRKKKNGTGSDKV